MKETLTKQLRQLKRTELSSISLVTISVIPDRGSKTLWCQFWYSVHVDLQPHRLSGLFFSNKLKRLTFVSLITQLRADSSHESSMTAWPTNQGALSTRKLTFYRITIHLTSRMTLAQVVYLTTCKEWINCETFCIKKLWCRWSHEYSFVRNTGKFNW